MIKEEIVETTEGTMDLDFLNFQPKPMIEDWVPCEVVFFGNQDYILCSINCEAQVEIVEGGFKTKFRQPVAISAELFLGKKIKEATITNIELVMPAFTLDMRKMYPQTFPRKVTSGDIVGINP